MGVKRMQRAKLAAAYLLLALAAALGWLYSCLPDRVYLEPGQALYLPRFAWVEPQRGHGAGMSPAPGRWAATRRR